MKKNSFPPELSIVPSGSGGKSTLPQLWEREFLPLMYFSEGVPTIINSAFCLIFENFSLKKPKSISLKCYVGLCCNAT